MPVIVQSHMRNFSDIQYLFNQHHQDPYNIMTHKLTTFGIFYALFGLVNHNIIKINTIHIFILSLISYVYCLFIVCIIEDEEKYSIVSNCTQIVFGTSYVVVFTDKFMNNTKYLFVLINCVLIQEYAHILFQEEAMMYHYDGYFWEDFFSHGFYMIPLIAQLA